MKKHIILILVIILGIIAVKEFLIVNNKQSNTSNNINISINENINIAQQEDNDIDDLFADFYEKAENLFTQKFRNINQVMNKIY